MTDAPLLPEATVFGEPKGADIVAGHGREVDPRITALQAEVKSLQKQLNTARILWIVQGLVLLLIIFNGGVQ